MGVPDFVGEVHDEERRVRHFRLVEVLRRLEVPVIKLLRPGLVASARQL